MDEAGRLTSNQGRNRLHKSGVSDKIDVCRRVLYFWCDISNPEASAAGSDDPVDLVFTLATCPGSDYALNVLSVVADNGGVPNQKILSIGQYLLDSRTRSVGATVLSSRIAHCERHVIVESNAHWLM